MRNNIEHIHARAIRHSSDKYGIVSATLTGIYRIPADGPSFHFLDPNGSDRTVYLPALSPFGGQQYWIVNLATATYELDVVDVNGAAVRSLAPETVAIFISSQTGWKFASSLPDAIDYLAHELQDPTTVTTTPYVVTAERLLRMNVGSAATVTLPAASTRLSPRRNLIVKDISGAVLTSDRPITINRASTDVIDTGTSIQVLNDFGQIELEPRTGGWDIVNYG